MEELKQCAADAEQNEDPQPSNSKKRNAKVWVQECVYEDETKAQAFIDGKETWSVSSVKESGKGRKKFFRCRAGSFRKNECPAAIYLLYHGDSRKVTLYRADVEHVHTDVSKPGLPWATRQVINQLLDEGTNNPTAILACLQKKGIKEPLKQQLYNYLARARRAKVPTTSTCTIRASELKAWCEQRTLVPHDPDRPFVVSFQVSAADPFLKSTKEDLKVFISTKRLLETLKISNMVQVDTTHKLNWQGHPVFIVGTTDVSRRFHAYGLAICYGEQQDDFQFIFAALKQFCDENSMEWKPAYLLANSCEAITKAFEATFPETEFRRLTCFSHVNQCVKSRLRDYPNQVGADILQDIVVLHECDSEATFDKAAELFIKKWEGNELCTEFLNHFCDQWLGTYRFWCKAASGKHPSTNCALEAETASIKSREILRKGLPVNEFLTLVEECLVTEWSKKKAASGNSWKLFAEAPPISLNLWRLSYEWAAKNTKILKSQQDAAVIYYLQTHEIAQSKEAFSLEFVQDVLAKYGTWATFDEYVRYRHVMWTVKCCGGFWTSYQCSCPVYLEDSMCKHVVGIALKLNEVRAPEEAKCAYSATKRKRGPLGKCAIIKD